MTRMASPLPALAFVLITLACALPKGPVARACPGPQVDTQDWREVTIASAGATMRVPPDVDEPLWNYSTSQHWFGQDFEITTFIGDDPNGLSAAVVPFIPFASWSVKSHESRCAERIDDSHSRIRAYFEHWTPFAKGHHVATAAYELVPGSWLIIGGVSHTGAHQEQLLAAFRTIQFLPPPGSSRRPPAPLCASKDSTPADWREFEAVTAPITFRAPAGTRRRSNSPADVWDVGPMRVDLELLGTNNWILEPAKSTNSTWCSITLEGRYVEVLVVPKHAADWPEEFFDAVAYIQLSPTQALHVFAYVRGRDGPQRFFALLRSLRVRAPAA